MNIKTARASLINMNLNFLLFFTYMYSVKSMKLNSKNLIPFSSCNKWLESYNYLRVVLKAINDFKVN